MLLPAWLLWLCVFLFQVSLFSVCGCWISHCESPASIRYWNITIRCEISVAEPLDFIISSLALLASAAYQASSPLCFCLLGFLQSAADKGKSAFNHGNYLGLFQRLSSTDIQKMLRLPSLLLLLLLWTGGDRESWTPVHPFLRALSCYLVWHSSYSAFLVVFSKPFIFEVLGTVCSFAIQRSSIQVHIYICLSTCCFCFHLLLHFLLDSQLQINSILFTLKWNTIIWQLAYSTMLEVR